MIYRYKFKFVLLSLLLIILLSLCSCSVGSMLGFDDNSALSIISDSKSEYRIVCAYEADSDIIDSALSVINTARTKSGAEIELVIDSNAVHDNSNKEIIVGSTNRGLPEGFEGPSPMEFVIVASDNDIYIIGGSDSATIMALEYFAENIIAEETILERDYKYSYCVPYTVVNINSAPVTSFKINALEGVDTIAVSQALISKTGLDTSDDDNYTDVYFELDYSLDTNTVRFAEQANSILISASSKIALTKIDEVILEGFGEYATINLDHGSYVDFTYPIVSLNEISDYSDCYLECETNKSPLEYAVGEEMVYTLSLKYDGEIISAPNFSYKIDFDDTKESITENVSGEKGTFVIQTSLDTPGFVKIYANVTSDLGIEYRDISPFEGGAAANIRGIAQAVKEPDDFDEFWQAELENLYETEPVMSIKNDLSESYPGYTVLDIRIDCPGGPVSAYLSIPNNAKEGSLPILVGYLGYGVFSPKPTVRNDRIVLSVNAHSLDNGRESGYYKEVSSTVLYSYGFNTYENSNRDTVYFKNMILRDVQAIRYLKTLKEWDGESISLNGGSQGAYQALAVAALDPDVTYVYAAYPWLCDIGSFAANRIGGWHPDYTDALTYYDAINFAKRIKCQTRIVAGLGDYVSPPSSVAALVNSMSAPVSLEFIQGMTHTYTPPYEQMYKIEK